MRAKVIMVQGTASSVGKSVMVAALCRIFKQDGYSVAPFKSQNMALNSFVTRGGGEIGRAQAAQAEAAGIQPTVDMNPILLKPEADSRCQVIVLGKVDNTMSASRYYDCTPRLLEIAKESLERLRQAYDIVVIEGAGSAAEVNLKEREIVNMRIARLAEAPVLLVGDIDRGGIFASLYGTIELLEPDERNLVRGLIINKFRGDISLFKSGVEFLEKATHKPVLGVIPCFRDITIAQEDSVYLDERPNPNGKGTDIAIIRLPHIANYDDFDALEAQGANVRFVSTPAGMSNPDLMIIPGTKSTISDLSYIRNKGLDKTITGLCRQGTPVIGICGGFQMLGKRIEDCSCIESDVREVNGLGLLDIDTVFQPSKTTTQVKAKTSSGLSAFCGTDVLEVSGYEIHMGQCRTHAGRPAFQVFETPEGKTDYPDGCVSEDGKVFGTYIHGLFDNADFTRSLLDSLRRARGLAAQTGNHLNRNAEYDKLALVVRQNLDMKKIYEIIGERMKG